YKNDRYYRTIEPANFHFFHAFEGFPNERKLPKDGDGDFFAIGKFKFSSNLTAYITRQDNEDNEGIFLVLVDSSTGKTVSTVSKAGWSWGVNDNLHWTESWLMDVNSDGYLDIVTKTLD